MTDDRHLAEKVYTRADLIEALSWAEDMERGRWGVEHATAVLEAHEARVRLDALREAYFLLEPMDYEPLRGTYPEGHIARLINEAERVSTSPGEGA